MVKKTKMWSEYFKINVYNEYITQGSDTLVITLPGTGYGSMAPLLYYSISVALELHYDVLTVEYDFKEHDRKLSKEDCDYLYEDIKKVIDLCLTENTYKNIVLIGKSIGTYILSNLTKELIDYETKYVFLTPIDISLEGMKKVNALVVIGKNDRCLSNDDIDKLRYYSNIKLVLVPGDHCLDNDSYKDSLVVLEKVINEIEIYIK